jgi:hypothetical protein
VEVGRGVLAVVHTDHDSEEAADLRHLDPSQPPLRVAASGMRPDESIQRRWRGQRIRHGLRLLRTGGELRSPLLRGLRGRARPALLGLWRRVRARPALLRGLRSVARDGRTPRVPLAPRHRAATPRSTSSTASSPRSRARRGAQAGDRPCLPT